MVDQLTRAAIRDALRVGTVPAVGLEHLAVGVDPHMEEMRSQLELVARGQSRFKFLRGGYGSGKTFLASLLLAEAAAAGFVVSQVVISANETPLHKLDAVYARICQNLATPARQHALRSIVDRWFYKLEEQVVEVDGLSDDHPEFAAAVGRKVDNHLHRLGESAGTFARCLKAYYELQFAENFMEAQGMMDWLSGSPNVSAAIRRQAGVRGDVTSPDALTFLRGLLEVIGGAGHKGLVVVFDEVETLLRQRSDMRKKGLETLRGLVDKLCANELPGVYMVFTGTPEFFDAPTGVPSLQPLHERIRVEFTEGQRDNFRQPQIRLLPFNRDRLLEVAVKVRDLYPADNPSRLLQTFDAKVLQAMVDECTRAFGGHLEVAPRLFLRHLVDQLDRVDQYADHTPTVGLALDGVEVRDEERSFLVSL